MAILPAIDVIVPFHRIDEFLYQAIHSVHQSVGVSPRLVLVNDSNSLVARSDLPLADVDLLVTSEIKGYQGALSKGVAHIQNEYVGFLDSDDLTGPQRFSNQVKSLNESANSISIGRLIKVDHQGKQLIHNDVLGNVDVDSDIRYSWFFGSHGADSSIVARSQIIVDSWAGHQNYPTELSDFGWLLNVSLSAKMQRCNDAPYFYRMHRDQMSRKKATSEAWISLFPTWKRAVANIDPRIHNFLLHYQDPLVFLPLVFPSSRVKLSKHQRVEFKQMISDLLENLLPLVEHKHAIFETVQVRRLIGLRQLDRRSLSLLPKTIFRIVAYLAQGVLPRP